MNEVTMRALAQAAAPDSMPSVGGQMAQMLPMFILIIVIFYFVIYRPQKQQREKQQDMISQLKKGDKVVTSGGLWGTVTNVGKETVTLQVAENAKIKVVREHIVRLRGEGDD
jgi:preprotein translocase subunit YajC